jgi:hypothetical protein
VVKQTSARFNGNFEVGWVALRSKSLSGGEAHCERRGRVACASSVLNVVLRAEELCYHAPKETWSGNALLLRCYSRHRWWRSMHWHRLGVSLPTASREDKAPVDVMACRTHKGVVLETRGQRGIGRDHLHQDHLCVARQTMHRTHSPTNNGFLSAIITARMLRMSDVRTCTGGAHLSPCDHVSSARDLV